MKYWILVGALSIPTAVQAGCIGAIVNGRCMGKQVPWDTHMPKQQHPDPPPGWYWDYRGTDEYQRRPQDFDPFTGRDPHDSQWLNQEDE